MPELGYTHNNFFSFLLTCALALFASSEACFPLGQEHKQALNYLSKDLTQGLMREQNKRHVSGMNIMMHAHHIPTDQIMHDDQTYEVGFCSPKCDERTKQKDVYRMTIIMHTGKSNDSLISCMSGANI